MLDQKVFLWGNLCIFYMSEGTWMIQANEQE